MSEAWSDNKLSEVFRVDRRTVKKYRELAGLKPAGSGAKGSLWDVREVAAALADAGFLGGDDPHRWREWGSSGGRESGGREVVERVMHALSKRLDKAALRVAAEVVAEALHRHIADIYPSVPDAAGGAAPDWAALSDADLERAVRALIVHGFLPDAEAD